MFCTVLNFLHLWISKDFEFLKLVNVYHLVSCFMGKCWTILQIQRLFNSQDVKDSERFKPFLVSACFEAFKGPAKSQFFIYSC